MLDLPDYVVVFYFAVVAFIIGWAMPRGKYLKAIQLRFFKALHNFFADEEEYIQNKVERVRKITTRRKK
jgi:uncharacterized ion transporter superfamily protein YfcC